MVGRFRPSESQEQVQKGHHIMGYTAAEMIRSMQLEYQLTLPVEEHQQQKPRFLTMLVRLFKR